MVRFSECDNFIISGAWLTMKSILNTAGEEGRSGDDHRLTERDLLPA